ncbi:MAG: hypothetical protein IPG79_20895 [Saprospiraceae bacterium]|nr:hypothetical protein [Saprospiraceae bacterium]
MELEKWIKSVLETIDFEFGIWIALNILGLNEINIQPLRGCEIWYVLSPGFTRSYQYSSLSGLGNIVKVEIGFRLGNIVNEDLSTEMIFVFQAKISK